MNCFSVYLLPFYLASKSLVYRFCRLCNQVLPNTLRFSLQRQKAQEFCKAEFLNSMPVDALELGTLFPNSAQAEFGSFGLRLLISQGFLGAKAGHSDRAARRVEESFSALEKQGKLYFLKVVKYTGEGKPTFSTRSFPLSLNPSPRPCGDRGNPPDPLCYVSLSGTGNLISEFSVS